MLCCYEFSMIEEVEYSEWVICCRVVLGWYMLGLIIGVVFVLVGVFFLWYRMIDGVELVDGRVLDWGWE